MSRVLISNLDLISIRSRIGYVRQEAEVFTDTTENNVSFWDPDSTPEKVFKAHKMAYAD